MNGQERGRNWDTSALCRCALPLIFSFDFTDSARRRPRLFVGFRSRPACQAVRRASGFLLHIRSSLVAILMLPVGILMAFGAMRMLRLGANIMSLGGIAIAIGAMIDGAIAMIENAHKHLERAAPGKPRTEVLIEAVREVGPSLFFSLLYPPAPSSTSSATPARAMCGGRAPPCSPLSAPAVRCSARPWGRRSTPTCSWFCSPLGPQADHGADVLRVRLAGLQVLT